jgi:hypothetical protein
LVLPRFLKAVQAVAEVQSRTLEVQSGTLLNLSTSYPPQSRL